MILKEFNINEGHAATHGYTELGQIINFSYYDDPKRLTYLFSRYKFVAKMLEGFENVLEVGCGDGFASRVVKQHVHNLTAIDLEPKFIEDAKKRVCDKWYINFLVHDILSAPLIEKKFDGAYSIDVLEHIPPQLTDSFFRNISKSLKQDGVCIIGTPSKEMQQFYDSVSKGHVNCYNGYDLKNLMLNYFKRVFLFSMNDEVIHTGFVKMACFLFLIGVAPKKI